MGAGLYLLRIRLRGILWDWGAGSKEQNSGCLTLWVFPVSISLQFHVAVHWLHIGPGPMLLRSAGGGEGYPIFRKDTNRPASIGEESPG